MAPGKEEPLAFMPSPNDSIPTFEDIDGFPSPRSSFSQPHQADSGFSNGTLHRQDSTPLSPRATAISIETTDTMSSLPQRPSVSSASPMPHELQSAPCMSNEASWQQRYFDLKAHNDDVIRALRNELHMIKLELSNTRNDSLVGATTANENARRPDAQIFSGIRNGNGTKPGQTEAKLDGPFSPRYSFDAQSHEHAEQLRRSPSSSNRPIHTSFSKQLSSIPETSLGGQVDGGSESTLRASGLTSPARNDDDPPSPPTSAHGFSPPNRKTLAGYTPPSAIFGRLNDPDAKPVEKDELMRASDRQLMAEQGLDEDPALSEPRILQHADDFMALDRKLQRVASDPDMNPPAASSSSANVEADANTEAGLNERAADPEDPLQGIKLKRKPSTNFGAPLGQLR